MSASQCTLNSNCSASTKTNQNLVEMIKHRVPEVRIRVRSTSFKSEEITLSPQCPSVASGMNGDQHWKTKLCPFLFGVKKVCGRRGSCSYAHSTTDLRNRPDLTKTKLCDLYMKGRCTDVQCKWAHGRHELRFTDEFYKTSLCKYWVESICYAGDACRHAHGNADLRPKKLPLSAELTEPRDVEHGGTTSDQEHSNSPSCDSQHHGEDRGFFVTSPGNNNYSFKATVDEVEGFNAPVEEKSIEESELPRPWSSEILQLSDNYLTDTTRNLLTWKQTQTPSTSTNQLSSVISETSALFHPSFQSWSYLSAAREPAFLIGEGSVPFLWSDEPSELYQNAGKPDTTNTKRSEQLESHYHFGDIWGYHPGDFFTLNAEKTEPYHSKDLGDMSWGFPANMTSPKVEREEKHTSNLHKVFPFISDDDVLAPASTTKDGQGTALELSPLLPKEVASALSLKTPCFEPMNQYTYPMRSPANPSTCSAQMLDSDYLRDYTTGSEQSLQRRAMSPSSIDRLLIRQSESEPSSLYIWPEQHQTVVEVEPVKDHNSQCNSSESSSSFASGGTLSVYPNGHTHEPAVSFRTRRSIPERIEQIHYDSLDIDQYYRRSLSVPIKLHYQDEARATASQFSSFAPVSEQQSPSCQSQAKATQWQQFCEAEQFHSALQAQSSFIDSGCYRKYAPRLSSVDTTDTIYGDITIPSYIPHSRRPTDTQ